LKDKIKGFQRVMGTNFSKAIQDQRIIKQRLNQEAEDQSQTLVQERSHFEEKKKELG